MSTHLADHSELIVTLIVEGLGNVPGHARSISSQACSCIHAKESAGWEVPCGAFQSLVETLGILSSNPKSVNHHPWRCHVMICKRSELQFIRSAMKDLASSQPPIDLMIYEDALKTTATLAILGTARPTSLETGTTTDINMFRDRERER